MRRASVSRISPVRIILTQVATFAFRCEAFRQSVIPTQEESPLVRVAEKGIPPAPALVRVGMTWPLTG